MKETGIIMSGNHPKLILEKIKTQTRRVLRDTKMYFAKDIIHRYQLPLLKECPYGQVGDRLWVKETHIFEINEDYPKDPRGHCDEEEDLYLIPHYKADGVDISDWLDMESGDIGGKWRPSIFMPRWASRITLEITGIRVERLQEITEEDCKAEGVKEPCSPYLMRTEFKELWDSLNAKRGYGWDTNPWVWVISFRKVE